MSPGKTLHPEEAALALTVASFVLSKAKRDALSRLIFVRFVIMSSVNWMVSEVNRLLDESEGMTLAATPKVEALTAVLRRDQLYFHMVIKDTIQYLPTVVLSTVIVAAS